VIIATEYHPLIIWLPAALASVGLVGIGIALSRGVGLAGGSATAGDFGSAADVTKAGRRLSDELANVLALIRSHLGSSETFAQSLTSAQSRLGALKEPQQVRVIVSLLVAENERMRLDTGKLQGKLEESQAQIESLNTSLAEAQEMGLKDSLTSVGNRRCFDATLKKEIGEAKSNAAPLTLVMCDIDDFKKINDTYGHSVGDEVLKMLASVLTANVRDSDTVARIGGEEFGIILPQTTKESALKLAERIRGQCEARRLTVRNSSQKIGSVTASFGLAELQDGESPVMLVERADAKLYEAKSGGRNKVAG
jgi:diguanylate cyclase